MGSKRALLANGLGEVLKRTCTNLRPAGGRFLDLFAGTGSVSWFVSERHPIEVVSNDLQSFAVTMCVAVTGREREIDALELWGRWLLRANSRMRGLSEYADALRIDGKLRDRQSTTLSLDARKWARSSTSSLARAYAGFYYSPLQAVQIAALRKTVPDRNPERALALAALINAASMCAAAPGHTAQPFRPGRSSNVIFRYWRRSVVEYTFASLLNLAPRHALRKGRGRVGDALGLARTAQPSDVVFLDPPYSAVQYSRFYHVLESVARGSCGQVSGDGRYPPLEERPQSDYSLITRASAALDELLSTVADRRATGIVTFPLGAAGNGLSGRELREVATRYFRVTERHVGGRFSTMGGNGTHRPARQASEELVLVLRPRRARSGTSLKALRATQFGDTP